MAIPVLGQESIPATPPRARTFVAIGAGGHRGNFEITGDTSGERTNETRHVHRVGGLVAEARHERPSGWGAMVRVTMFRGDDRAPASTLIPHTFGPPPRRAAWDTARVDGIEGMSAAIGLETPLVGFMAGVVTGTWSRRADHPMMGLAAASRSEPVGEVRVGRLWGWRGEAGLGTHFPGPAPGPRYQGGLAYTSAPSGHTYRFGLSTDGIYFGLRYLDRTGFELEPYVSFGSPTLRVFALTLRQRIYLRR